MHAAIFYLAAAGWVCMLPFFLFSGGRGGMHAAIFYLAAAGGVCMLPLPLAVYTPHRYIDNVVHLNTKVLEINKNTEKYPMQNMGRSIVNASNTCCMLKIFRGYKVQYKTSVFAYLLLCIVYHSKADVNELKFCITVAWLCWWTTTTTIIILRSSSAGCMCRVCSSSSIHNNKSIKHCYELLLTTYPRCIHANTYAHHQLPQWLVTIYSIVNALHLGNMRRLTQQERTHSDNCNSSYDILIDFAHTHTDTQHCKISKAFQRNRVQLAAMVF